MERLEAEIDRAVQIINQLRVERDDLQKRCEVLQETTGRQQTQIDGLKSEIDGLKLESAQRREEVRTKIESMLARLDAIKAGE